MRTYYFIIILILSACISESQTPKSIFEGTWQYNPKLISDTLSISDDFSELDGHLSKYLIHSDSGWQEHTYFEDQKVKIMNKEIHFCMKFNFIDEYNAQIITFRLDSLTENPPALLAFEDLTYEFNINDSIVTLIDSEDGSKYTRHYKSINPNLLTWDGDTLRRINMP